MAALKLSFVGNQNMAFIEVHEPSTVPLYASERARVWRRWEKLLSAAISCVWPAYAVL